MSTLTADARPIEQRIDADLLAFPPPWEAASLATGWGLTKRELFAAMSMQSVRAVNPACTSQEVAQSAVADADALLKELAK